MHFAYLLFALFADSSLFSFYLLEKFEIKDTKSMTWWMMTSNKVLENPNNNINVVYLKKMIKVYVFMI